MRRSLTEQLARVEEGLAAPSPRELERGVHEARRALKKMRALLRLVRGAMEPEAFRERNALLREVGRRVGGLRDTTATLLAARNLRPPRPERNAEVERLVGRLARRRTRAFRDAVEGPGGRGASSGLARARRALSRTRVGADGFAALSEGLAETYGRGRRAAARCRRGGATADAFHEWRKRGKDLRHQLEWIGAAWPTVLGAWSLELHALTDALGDANDLDVLADLGERDPTVLARLDVDALERRMENRRAALWADALERGARTYAEPPAVFVRRIGVYVEAWRRALPASR